MFTFKQLEALYWVVKLGGFTQAANQLHTTQSAVSKRVQELEGLVETPLFDRSFRTARLSSRGEEMFQVAQRLLQERELAMASIVNPERLERHLRIGVTEVTAMTWLPRLVNLITSRFPRIRVEPTVESGSMLREKLLTGELDMTVAADTVLDGRFVSQSVGRLHLDWMCKPGLVHVAKQPMRASNLVKHPLLRQQEKSANGKLLDQWFRVNGVKPAEVLVSNSMLAQIGMTVAGAGVSYLPSACLSNMVDSGLLEIIDVVPKLPRAEYLATYRVDLKDPFLALVAQLSKDSCDFSRMFQT
jgi:DNA-binding transcriptional LysR family regulator